MNIADIILLLPLVYGLYSGYRKGIVRQIIGISGLFIAFILSCQYGEIFTQSLIKSQILKENIAPFVSHILFFALVFFALNILGRILRKLIKTIGLGGLESLLGGIIGGVKNFLILSVLLFVIIKLNNNYHFGNFEILHKSIVFSFFERISFPILQKFL